MNIPLSELEFKRKPPTVVEPVIPKAERPRMLNKNEKAERILIFSMLRSRDVCMNVVKELKPTDFADHITATIRIQLEHYYEDHLEFNLNEFLDGLASDQREHMEKNLLKDMYWVNNFSTSDEEIENYIRLIKEANLKRRYDYLNDKINNLEEYSEHLVKERDAIKLQLMKKN